MKVKVVVIESNGARIYTNPGDLKRFKGKKYLVNPEMNHMQGIPLHKWDIQDGKIIHNPNKKVKIHLPYDKMEYLRKDISKITSNNRRQKYIQFAIILNILAIYLILILR